MAGPDHRAPQRPLPLPGPHVHQQGSALTFPPAGLSSMTHPFGLRRFAMIPGRNFVADGVTNSWWTPAATSIVTTYSSLPPPQPRATQPTGLRPAFHLGNFNQSRPVPFKLYCTVRQLTGSNPTRRPRRLRLRHLAQCVLPNCPR
ncbi:hypothetical protein BC936DRAFT_144890 [Jimgerdemannia flammicorona]|uniref:Uncharacterized protein n=1 Tax=Jimgerdemannia flammicorona TaxID=994334 RepID=A0A433DBE1_9FUNG|nr:hypothetical protein BC936DRAFT_144890 [Jimgerdemannia flammicorona]